jgi:hypothetical protein
MSKTKRTEAFARSEIGLTNYRLTLKTGGHELAAHRQEQAAVAVAAHPPLSSCSQVWAPALKGKCLERLGWPGGGLLVLSV